MLDYFFDPILQATTIGTCLMCLASSLIGVVVFIQKRSLLGESLYHSTYPGVILGGLFSSAFFEDPFFLILPGAMLSALLGLKLINLLTKKGRISQDAALCFVLTFFFSIGVFLASRIQFTETQVYRQLQVYLYGQAATMMQHHVYIYVGFCLLSVSFLALFYHRIQVLLFDSTYAKSLGIKHKLLEVGLSFLLVLSIIIGIRCVGIVLMSGMLIAPAIAARALTKTLSKMFLIAAFFGVLSGLLGNVLANEISLVLTQFYPNKSLYLPTGPMIIIVGFIFAFSALLFAPQKGLFLRIFRILKFRTKCQKENLLKMIYKNKDCDVQKLRKDRFSIFFLWQLKKEGYVSQKNKIYCLTEDGRKKVLQIIRFHRLWEVYLAEYMQIGIERVHRSAEDMEHIITPEIERKLTNLLSNPKTDPHKQPIPDRFN